MAADDAHADKPSDIVVINLHQAVVATGDVPFFVPVFTNSLRVEVRLFDGDRLQQKGINVVALSRFGKTLGMSLSRQAQTQCKQEERVA